MKERLQLFDAVRSAVPAEMPVLLGTGDLARRGQHAGPHHAGRRARCIAALVLSPRQGDVRAFYGEVVAAAGTMPVLAYHWPKVSPPGIRSTI